MKGVLNKARKSIPTSHGIWMHLRSPNKKSLTRRQREGTQISRNRPQDDQNGRVGVAKARGVVRLRTMVAGSRNARRRGTCEAIVKATVAMKVEEEDRFSTWVESMKGIATARAILAYALKVFPNRVKLWEMAAYLEQSHGTGYV